MITLYSYPQCPYSRKVQIVLEEKGLPYTLKKINLADGEHRTEQFLALNPFGKVPVLLDDSVVLFESQAIVTYLETNYPTPALLPEGPDERGRACMLENVHDHYLSRHLYFLVEQYIYRKPADRDNTGIADCFKQIQHQLSWLDTQLVGRHFFGKDLFSVADCAYVHALVNLIPQFNVDMSPHGHLRSWINRTSKRPSVMATNPGMIRKAAPTAKKAS